MVNQIIVMVLIGILIVTFLGYLIYLRKVKSAKKRDPDYRTLFIIGCTWIPLGLALKNPGFWIGGLIFMVVGLANKKKWKEDNYSKLPKEKKRILLGLLIGGAIFFAAGIIFYLVKTGVINV